MAGCCSPALECAMGAVCNHARFLVAGLWVCGGKHRCGRVQSENRYSARITTPTAPTRSLTSASR